MKHKKRLKPAQVWNRYICPAIEYIILAAVALFLFVILPILGGEPA